MKHFCLTVAILSGAFSFAQGQNTARCGSDHYYEQHLQNHPEVIQERQELEEFTREFAKNYAPEAKKASITIPVVFHVNDPSNPQKVTLAQIQSALDILNEDFTATNSDITNIRPEFTGLIANMDINFCLASKDPNGNATTGVTYHMNNYNGREPNGYGSSVKGVSYWPGEKYLNIWIVNYVEDDGSLYNSGWAYLPDSWVASNDLDGIVYNHRYLGYTGSSEVSGSSSWQAEMARVLTHEVGHYLNLHHTFYNYCSSPGDYVDDTPYVYYHGSNNCDQLGTLCSGTSVVMDQNYMDYTPCPSMYTLGQKTRVMAALNSSVAGRNNLWTTNNLIATGCASDASLNDLSEIDNTLVYPNPAETQITLEFNLTSQEEVSVVLRNTFGQQLEHFDQSVSGSQTITIPVGHLSDGIYFLEIHNGSYSTVKKLVKGK